MKKIVLIIVSLVITLWVRHSTTRNFSAVRNPFNDFPYYGMRYPSWRRTYPWRYRTHYWPYFPYAARTLARRKGARKF